MLTKEEIQEEEVRFQKAAKRFQAAYRKGIAEGQPPIHYSYDLTEKTPPTTPKTGQTE